jgi:hypothetical protein
VEGKRADGARLGVAALDAVCVRVVRAKTWSAELLRKLVPLGKDGVIRRAQLS